MTLSANTNLIPATIYDLRFAIYDFMALCANTNLIPASAAWRERGQPK
jgi:hypothetical protein